LLTLNARCGEGRGGKVCSLRCTSPANSYMPATECRESSAVLQQRLGRDTSSSTLNISTVELVDGTGRPRC
jgi:hypothetical protein